MRRLKPWTAVAGIFVFAACGRDALKTNVSAEREAAIHQGSESDFGDEAFSLFDAAISLLEINVKKGVIEPPRVPDNNEITSNNNSIKIIYDLDFDVNGKWDVDYDPKGWVVTIPSTTGGDPYKFTDADGTIKVTSDPASVPKISKTALQLTVLLTVPGGKIPAGWITTTGLEKSIEFKLSFLKTASGTSASMTGLPSVIMRNDKSILANPPVLISGYPRVVDLGLILGWTAPVDTSAEFPAGTPVAEKSSVGKYRVIYWDIEECKRSARAGEWKFEAGKDRVAKQCAFPTNLDSSCNMGCGADDNYAIPVIPSDEAPESTCYKVMKNELDLTNSTISDLKNGTKYGFAIWALNSSGVVGKGRACGTGTPEEIPLASALKNPSNKKTKTDCFVVTAASGDADSRAVTAWRIIRDRHLRGTAFFSWYYQNGPKLASWLDHNPQLKPALNWIFETSGETIVQFENWFKRTWKKVENSQTYSKGIFFETAYAQVQESVPPALQPGESPIPGEDTPLDSPTLSPTPLPRATPEPTPAPKTEIKLSSENGAPGDESGKNSDPSYGVNRNSSSYGLHFYVSGLSLTDDVEIYKLFYPKKSPLKFSFAQSFRVFDAMGELGLGTLFSYTQMQGQVPNALPQRVVSAEVVNRRVSMYSYGMYGLVDARFRIPNLSWFAPRLAVSLGAERFRDEPFIEEPKASTKPSTGGTATGVVTPTGVFGFTAWKLVLNIKGSLEFSLGSLFPQEAAETRYGYGLEDYVISVFGGYQKDFDKGGIFKGNVGTSLSGYEFGAGIGFLLL